MPFGNATTIDQQPITHALKTSPSLADHLDPDFNAYNPKFDPRIYKEPNPGGVQKFTQQLLRGRMTMLVNESVPPGGVKKTRSLNFLYNPNTITHSFAFDNSTPPYYSALDGSDAKPLMSGQAVSWSLYFNRMYETGPTDVYLNQEYESGVLVDIAAFEYMIGSDGGFGVQATPLIVLFGATPGGRPFFYFGWITDATITYQMFTPRMIPIVCQVDVTLARRRQPDGSADQSDAAKAAAAQGIPNDNTPWKNIPSGDPADSPTGLVPAPSDPTKLDPNIDYVVHDGKLYMPTPAPVP